MTDQYLPPPVPATPDQHDTAVHWLPGAPQPATGIHPGDGPGRSGHGPAGGSSAEASGGYRAGTSAGYGADVPGGYRAGPGGPQWFVPGHAAGVGNPEAEYWAGRFRRQRTWTRVAVAIAALGALATVGIGIAAAQVLSSDPVVAAADGLPDAPGAVPEGGLPGAGAPPDGGTPDAADGEVPGGPAIPLPGPLQDLGRALGITDAAQLIDLAVANGLLSQEDADKLRAAIAAGQALQGLAGGAEPGTDS